MKSFVYLRALRAFVVEILDGAACAHVDGKQLVRRRLRHEHQEKASPHSQKFFASFFQKRRPFPSFISAKKAQADAAIRQGGHRAGIP
jgi:hypothetical protein